MAKEGRSLQAGSTGTCIPGRFPHHARCLVSLPDRCGLHRGCSAQREQARVAGKASRTCRRFRGGRPRPAAVCARDRFHPRGLDRVVSGMFPVNAVNFLRQNPPPGPLYNTFDWGGFLTWYMPQYPVSIDGRTDLYGDKMETVAFETESGDLSYKTDPVLNESVVVLLRNRDGLVSALDLDPRFRKIYQDAIATVFVRQAP